MPGLQARQRYGHSTEIQGDSPTRPDTIITQIYRENEPDAVIVEVRSGKRANPVWDYNIIFPDQKSVDIPDGIKGRFPGGQYRTGQSGNFTFQTTKTGRRGLVPKRHDGLVERLKEILPKL